MENVSIPLERLQQLIRAEHDANHLKALISEKYDNYESINREELKVLCALYCGNKED